ncbi:ATP-binding protein [Heliobacterium chlorum]|uniref:ATP-binding protein n=1 Tax=Heliobacterium chlorum TaxID=2698 RepID=A0ABR7SYI8_HELCL|nr:ATP-binding protein [Heliobacterium chlorum]MBC9783599.1 ATP-binding protein [Heliobacterium chlorum]
MKLHFEIASTFEAVDQVVQQIVETFKKDFPNHPPRTAFIIDFALREIMNNAVEHGNRMDVSKRVLCDVRVEGQRIYLAVTDEGSGFELNKAIPENVLQDLTRERNRGLQIISLMGFTVSVLGSSVRAELSLETLEKREVIVSEKRS